MPRYAGRSNRPRRAADLYLRRDGDCPRASPATSPRSPWAKSRGAGRHARSSHPRRRRRARSERRRQPCAAFLAAADDLPEIVDRGDGGRTAKRARRLCLDVAPPSFGALLRRRKEGGYSAATFASSMSRSRCFPSYTLDPASIRPPTRRVLPARQATRRAGHCDRRRGDGSRQSVRRRTRACPRVVVRAEVVAS